EDVPAELWKDKTRVMTGFACFRCHAAGVKTQTDVLAPALETSGFPELKKKSLREWYAGRTAIANGANTDNERFAAARKKLEPTLPERSALLEVASRFREPTPGTG